MRILLTGATGFLGNHILSQLLAAQHTVTVTLRHSSDRRPLDGFEAEHAVVDLNDAAEIAPLVGEHDAVIHSAATIHLGWRKIEASRHVNVGSTQTLAAAARQHGNRMVYVSSVDALAHCPPDSPGDESTIDPPLPKSAYVVSKREAEATILAEVHRGLDAVIVNPGFFVGPRDWRPSSGEMMLTLAKQFIPLAPAGGCSIADVRDVAAGVIAALDRGVAGERYILGGHDVTYWELWLAMASVVGGRPPFRKLPNWIAKLAGGAGDFCGRFMSEEPQMNSAMVAMGQIHHWYSSQKAIQQLGYAYRDRHTTLGATLEESWQWFQQNGYA